MLSLFVFVCQYSKFADEDLFLISNNQDTVATEKTPGLWPTLNKWLAMITMQHVYGYSVNGVC